MFLGLGAIAQYVAPQYGIPIALAIAAVGFYIIRKADEREASTRDVELKTIANSAAGRRVLTPKRYLRGDDWIELEKQSQRVYALHGHDDRHGIRSDRLDGYTWAEIGIMLCHECKRPRNLGRTP